MSKQPDPTAGSIPLQAAERVTAAVDLLLRVDDRFSWAEGEERAHLRATYGEALTALLGLQTDLGVEPE